MKKILLFGAGKSSLILINYLLKHLQQHDWLLMVADYDLLSLQKKIKPTDRIQLFQIDIFQKEKRETLIEQSHLVISLLPVYTHHIVAQTCVKLKKNLITASYATEEIKQLSAKAEEEGVLIMMECGLDPGLDHMSAMQFIESKQSQGYEIVNFESFTGGLLAPDSVINNPWAYKFTWNPRNVVLSGQGMVKFIQQSTYKYIPYHRLFRRTEVIHIPDFGYYEGYANRDSIKYLDIYNLQHVKTIFRGTLRPVGFCKTWDAFVQLGATDDSFLMYNVKDMTHRQFINSFLYYNPSDSVELKLAHYLNFDIDSQEMYKLKWLGIFDQEPIGLETGTPAQILEHILKKKWTLLPEEKDMIIMWHKFDYWDGKKMNQTHAYMVTIGENSDFTAMAKTVGLPIGITSKLILQGDILLSGVQLPTVKEVYEPVLRELSREGITFYHTESEIPTQP
ncbi:MAG: saccharopine dehydrogenase family protein [Candidatus Cyclobacteriaceae bacterium M3_2C_046]